MAAGQCVSANCAARESRARCRPNGRAVVAVDHDTRASTRGATYRRAIQRSAVARGVHCVRNYAERLSRGSSEGVTGVWTRQAADCRREDRVYARDATNGSSRVRGRGSRWIRTRVGEFPERSGESRKGNGRRGRSNGDFRKWRGRIRGRSNRPRSWNRIQRYRHNRTGRRRYWYRHTGNKRRRRTWACGYNQRRTR